MRIKSREMKQILSLKLQIGCEDLRHFCWCWGRDYVHSPGSKLLPLVFKNESAQGIVVPFTADGRCQQVRSGVNTELCWQLAVLSCPQLFQSIQRGASQHSQDESQPKQPELPHPEVWKPPSALSPHPLTPPPTPTASHTPKHTHQTKCKKKNDNKKWWEESISEFKSQIPQGPSIPRTL